MQLAPRPDGCSIATSQDGRACIIHSRREDSNRVSAQCRDPKLTRPVPVDSNVLPGDAGIGYPKGIRVGGARPP